MGDKKGDQEEIQSFIIYKILVFILTYNTPSGALDHIISDVLPW